MARRRFFVSEPRDGRAEIAGDEARHLSQVLRVEPGQIFELSDNNGLYLAEVESAAKAQVRFAILERLPDPPPEPPVHLLAALFKFDRLEWMIEKATELGATSIRFVQAGRTEKGLEKAAEKRIERWRKIALEASQQSRRWRLPELPDPVSLKDGLATTAAVRIFLDEARDGVPLRDALTLRPDRPESIALLVGPEGGWTEAERMAAREAGWTLASLGDRILRAETAGIAALAMARMG